MRLIDFIIADDIRQELGNKISVMGIYNDRMNFNMPKGIEGPFPFHLGTLIRILLEENDQIPDRFSVSILFDEKEVGSITGGVKTTAEKINFIVIPIVVNALPIPGSGVLRANVKVYSGDTIVLDEYNPFPVAVEIVNI